MIRISEVFTSLQGEGIHAGVPMTFIRFQGCNLVNRCLYCDTTHAQTTVGGEDMEVEDLVDKVKLQGPDWVCITGGEPLLQEAGLEALVESLDKFNFKVTIETNGSKVPPYRWADIVHSWSADIKCPSSGASGTSKVDWIHMGVGDQVKFVVGTKEDFAFVKDLLPLVGRPTVLVSPVAPWSKELLQKTWEFCVDNNVRLSLQLHRIAWGEKRGV